MSEFRPLIKQSQHSNHEDESVLFLSLCASADILLDAAEYRANAAIGMLKAFSLGENSDAAGDVAKSAMLLFSDAVSLFEAAYMKKILETRQ